MKFSLLKRLSRNISKRNPTRQPPLKNDCVFVSIAYMLGMSNVEQLFCNINGTAPTDPDGITFDEIHEVLNKINLKFYWEDCTGTQVRPRRVLNVHPPQVSQPTCLGVIFRRKDGSGHCVVQDMKHSYNYIDYQMDPEGVSAWEDIRDASIESRFWIDQ
jgi:hypothetical protein